MTVQGVLHTTAICISFSAVSSSVSLGLQQDYKRIIVVRAVPF